MEQLITESDVRLFIYQNFLHKCRAPSLDETAKFFDTGTYRIKGIFKSLYDKNIIVLDSDSSEVKMAMPFSNHPTDYRVIIDRFEWYAN